MHTSRRVFTISLWRQLPTVGPGGSLSGFLSLRADNFRLRLACARRMDRKRQTTPEIPAEIVKEHLLKGLRKCAQLFLLFNAIIIMRVDHYHDQRRSMQIWESYSSTLPLSLSLNCSRPHYPYYPHYHHELSSTPSPIRGEGGGIFFITIYIMLISSRPANSIFQFWTFWFPPYLLSKWLRYHVTESL